jgi:hypothetical protein
MEDGSVGRFRVFKGETLFVDGEDSVSIHYLQKWTGSEWRSVYHLTLESGRSWGDEIDLIFLHKTRPENLLLHVAGFGYWGDTEYYQSNDGGDTWQPTHLRREPLPDEYTREILLQA